MSWNIVLNKLIEIQNLAIANGIDLWNYDSACETCLDYWVDKLNIDEYKQLIKYLELNEYGDFLLLRYADYSSVFNGETEVTFDTFWDIYDGFYRECRSVVINVKKMELVLVPFRKFRNLNEGEENSYENIVKRIEAASCVEFSNKLDGSMQSARYYGGDYIMSGSQAVDREKSWRLEDGFRMLMADENYKEMLRDNPDKTFIFEYISKRDAHVVIYDVEGLFLIGVRDVNTGREASYREILDFGDRYHVLTTELYDKTLDTVISELDDKRSSEAEGFVINIDGYKVKLKYNDYTAMHKILSKISSINLIIQNIAEGRFDDMIAKVPSAYRSRVLKVANLVYAYKTEIEDRVDSALAAAPKDDRKTFMLWVDANVDSDIKGFVRNKYLGKDYNALKTRKGYVKLKEMGINDYGSFFEE